MRRHWPIIRGAGGRTGSPGLTGTVLLALTMTACSSATALRDCAVEFSGRLCLDMADAGGLTVHQALIEEEVSEALAVIQPLLGVTDLRISVVENPGGVIPETGFGGFNPDAHEVRLFASSGWPDLQDVIRTELGPTLAHETHHAMRRRAVGYGSTLLQAAVTEGLADHFSIEVTPGYDPPWTRALTEEELAVWLPEVVARDSGAYSHPEWFFGVGGEAPRWTGYSVGFELVRRYVQDHPEAKPSDLVGEPALSFVPSDAENAPPYGR